MTAFTLLLSLSLFLWSHTIQAAMLCTKKSGAVFVRESCKVHETPVDPAILGIQPPLAVYDATGKKIGDVLDITSPYTARVFISVNQYPLRLGVYSFGGYFNGLSNFFYFESSDCTGMPLLSRFDFNEKPFFYLAAVFPPGHTLYIADPLATSPVLTIHSRKSPYDPEAPCELFSQEGSPFVPAISLGDLDTVFTPPFSLR